MPEEVTAPATGEPVVPAAAPAVVPAVEQKADAAYDFRPHLHESIRGAKTFEKFKGKSAEEVIGVLAKSYHDLEKFQVPGETASAEDRKKFFQRIGVPESPDKYAAKPEIPEGMPWNEGTELQFRQIAHKANLTDAQYKDLMAGYIGLAQKGLDVQAAGESEQLATTHQQLKEKWGSTYERNLGLVQRAVSASGVEGLSDFLDNKMIDGVKAGNHPVVLEFIAEYGSKLLDHGYIKGDAMVQTSPSTQAELNAILNDKTHAYWSGDKTAVAKVTAMFKALNPQRV